MNSHADEGLFVSVLIYFMALLFGLALFIGPVLWANGPTIEQNIGSGNVRELLASRYNRYSDSQYPIAKLKRQELLNPAPTVEMNARVKEAQNVRPSRYALERARHTQKIRHAPISHSRATPPQRTPPQRQYHFSSSALSAQY